MEKTWDYVIVGSGFGGSVSAMRLAEKGYSVLVLEKGKRLDDEDFAKSNWAFWKYLWAPKLRCHGVLQISLLKGLMVLRGTGLGGGSLGYANVLEVPNAETFATEAWNETLPWGPALEPHFATTKRMLGVTRNPKLWRADETLRDIAASLGRESSFRATEVGSWFGEAGLRVADPYFGGAGPEREGCNHCGGCMVGCRHNAKNTLPKNYLWFAEKAGAKLQAESLVTNVRPLSEGDGGSLYEVAWKSSTALVPLKRSLRTRHVIFAGGVLGTMGLLLRLRDVSASLPKLSARLGERVLTNSESLLGSIARRDGTDWSEGVAISSIFNADEVTRIEPVRYPAGSSLMRFLGAPLVSDATNVPARVFATLGWVFAHPVDFLRALLLPGWARRATILLVMQNVDNALKLKTGRSWLTGFRRGLVAEQYGEASLAARVDKGHEVTREFSRRIDGVNLGSVTENLFNLPTTAHILGGAPIGKDVDSGVVDEGFNVHNYPEIGRAHV